MNGISHIQGQTVHARDGSVANRFQYSVDFLCLDPEATDGPLLFSRDRPNLFSIRTCDHGGDPGEGRGAAWVREVLAKNCVVAEGKILLVAQPRVLGHVFNPVSFWLCHDVQARLIAVIAEVTNTFGDRHSYLCNHPGGRVITPDTRIEARKLLHVSPFQPVQGHYLFRFDIRADRIAIGIEFDGGDGSFYASLAGDRMPLTNLSIFAALLRRPLGSRRILGLIHWQALKLWWRGARYRQRPAPPDRPVSNRVPRTDCEIEIAERI